MLFEPFVVIGGLILKYWWLLAPVLLFPLAWYLWVLYVQSIYAVSRVWDTFEIRIPKEVEKSPKAMEQVFAALHGIHSGKNLIEQYWKGEFQDHVSFEIVGTEGETHFAVHAPRKYRRIIEAQIYAQYPDAEISDTEDYTKRLPSELPDEEYDMWGTELELTKPDAYPIRTYMAFEETLLERRIDPIASLLELFSSLRSREHIWIQFLLKPVTDEWKKEGEEIIAKMVKQQRPSPRSFFAPVTDLIRDVGSILTGLGGGEAEERAPGKETIFSDLTVGQQKIVEAIEFNIAKLGFETRIRILYIAPRSIIARATISGIFGAFKQFGSTNLNGFKPNKKVSTKIDYFFVKTRELYRKQKIYKAYRGRSFVTANPGIFRPDKLFVLNTEELATVYHFPGLVARAPLIPRIEAKKAEPPSRLPRVE